MRLKFPALLLATTFPLLVSVAGQAEEYEWFEELSADIAVIHDCEVAYLSHVVERQGDGGLMVMAKVHCVDQRTFDAFRLRTADVFQYKECTLREKQTC